MGKFKTALQQKPPVNLVPVSSKKLSPVQGLVSTAKQRTQGNPKNFVKVCPLFDADNYTSDWDGVTVTTRSSNSFAPLALKPAYMRKNSGTPVEEDKELVEAVFSVVQGEVSGDGVEKLLGASAVGDGDVDVSDNAPHDKIQNMNFSLGVQENSKFSNGVGNKYNRDTSQLPEFNDSRFTQQIPSNARTLPNRTSSSFSQTQNNKGLSLRKAGVRGQKVIFKAEHAKQIEETWGICLAGCFTGRFPGLQPIQSLTKSWGVYSRILTHSGGWIIFKFDSEEDRDAVLAKGPFPIGAVTLLLKKLNADFSFDKKDFLKVLVWVRVDRIPGCYWYGEGLSMIASALGTPICTDEVTATASRVRFARFLIEIDATETPLHFVECLLPCGKELMLKVTYESYPSYCCFCKVHGHNAWSCSHAENDFLAHTKRQGSLFSGAPDFTHRMPKSSFPNPDDAAGTPGVAARNTAPAAPCKGAHTAPASLWTSAAFGPVIAQNARARKAGKSPANKNQTFSVCAGTSVGPGLFDGLCSTQRKPVIVNKFGLPKPVFRKLEFSFKQHPFSPFQEEEDVLESDDDEENLLNEGEALLQEDVWKTVEKKKNRIKKPMKIEKKKKKGGGSVSSNARN